MKKPDRKPTILLITTDEQHRETLESYGATALKIPNMDRIGKEGEFERKDITVHA